MNRVIEQPKTIRCRRTALRCSPLRVGCTVIPLALFAVAYFALAPAMRAEDGCYPNGNTAEGCAGIPPDNTTAELNTAIGWIALRNNITGSFNTAVGGETLELNRFGSNNTAVGYGAMFRGRGGNFNTAVGYVALDRNQGGDYNTAYGDDALSFNTTGSHNIALGAHAGRFLTIGSNNIDIGNRGVADESNTIRLGTIGTQQATFIAGIHGTTTTIADAVPVVIDSDGQLGTVSSSARFKNEIKPMDKASETILGLKPVTFHYKSDNTGTAQFGLIAEEVAKANPDLVVRDDKGEIYTVRYDAVNAMLLNEFLKEHAKVEAHQAKIAELTSKLKAEKEEAQAKFAGQQKQLEALSAGLQKVGAAVTAQARGLRIAAAQP